MFIGLICFIMIGVLAGTFSGFLGCSSGVLVVPLLLLTFRMLHISSPHLMPLTVGTVLGIGAIALTTATLAQRNHFTINKTIFLSLLLGALFVAAPVFMVATYLSGKIFKMLFGMMILLLSLVVYPDQISATQQKLFRHPIALTLFAAISNFLGMTFGVGDGILFTPVLKRAGFSILEAFGNISAAGSIILSSFAIGYAIVGWHETLPAYSLGYVYLPALIGIGIPCIIMTRLCTHLRRRCSAHLLKIILCSVLLIIGIYMILNALFWTH